MPLNDQDLFDISSILTSIDSFTEGIEQHFESVSRSLKDTFRASPWLPDYIKPPPPPPTVRRGHSIPSGYFDVSRNWVSEHRAVTAAVIAFFGTGAFIIWRRRRSDRAKRRARKAKNGSRTEVVVLAGSPHSPLTRSLSQELERRGFIIYIPVGCISDEQLVRSESRPDIRPLSLDITSPDSTEETIRKFTAHINAPQQPIPKVPPHTLRLCAVIIVPGPTLPSCSIASLSSLSWSDTLNTRLLAPFTTLHAFLPLAISQSSTLLFLTPSILSSLTLPSHAMESVVTGGVHQYISTLRKETRGTGVNIVQLQLGHFDYGLSVKNDEQQLALSQHFSRVEATRHRLERKGLLRNPAKGTSLRELHNNVFDAIFRGKGKNGTIFVGRGSRTYDLVGKWVPAGIVGWMVGAGKSEIRTPTSEISEHEETSEAGWDGMAEKQSDEESYVYPRQ